MLILQLPATPIPVTRSRPLVGCDSGPASLSLNGRQGKGLACVLDSRMMQVEVLDMEGDSEDSEDSEDEEDEEME